MYPIFRSLTGLYTCLFIAFASTTLASEPVKDEKKPIIIGAAMAMSGFMAQYDIGPERTLEMAIADINAKGGVLGRPLKLILLDTKSERDTGANVGTELIEKGADFIIVSCNFDFGAPAAIAANAKKRLAFSPCGADTKFGVKGIGPYAFTMASSTASKATVMAEWAFGDKGWKTAYVLTDRTLLYSKTYAAAFKTRLSELGGKGAIVGEDTFQNADVSIAAQLTRIKKLPKKPDMIFLSSFPPGGPTALKQIRAAGINIPVVSTAAMDGTFWHGSVPNLSNLYYPAYNSLFGDDPDANINKMIQAYTARYKEAPFNSHALSGFATMQAFSLAAGRAKSVDNEQLKKAFESFKGEPTMIGATTFTPTVHIDHSRPMRIMQVQNGKNSFIKLQTPQKTITDDL
ncbi:MAG: ABC transporter substrate-binding protein [Myxococcaceae bacterium]